MTTNAYLDTGVSSDIKYLSPFYPVEFRCAPGVMPVRDGGAMRRGGGNAPRTPLKMGRTWTKPSHGLASRRTGQDARCGMLPAPWGPR